jgi:hypothetical protein
MSGVTNKTPCSTSIENRNVVEMVQTVFTIDPVCRAVEVCTCRRLIAVIADWNPTEGMAVLLCAFCVALVATSGTR